MAILINLYDKNSDSKIWCDLANEKLGKYHDKTLSKSFEMPFHDVISWVDRVAENEYTTVFISDLYRFPWETIKHIFDEKKIEAQIYGFLPNSNPEQKPWYVLNQKTMVAGLHGIFLPSAWSHLVFLTYLGLSPQEAPNIRSVGYPMNDIKAIPLEKKYPIIYWPYSLSNKHADFVLNVIEYFDNTYGLRNLESREFVFSFNHPQGDPEGAEAYLIASKFTRLLNSLEHVKIKINQDSDIDAMQDATVVLGVDTQLAYDPILATGIALGCHPVVPTSGFYTEMVRTDLSKDRYTYAPYDIESCVQAIINGMKQPSPPARYIEPNQASFHLMAKIITGSEDE